MEASEPDFLLGVLGGMGPLATVDFLTKLIDATPADGDADHVPVVVASIPRIPSRVEAIMGRGESPLPALVRARDRLLAAGATLLAMPCNTAHHWYPALSVRAGVPFLHIGEAAIAELARTVRPYSRIGVIATAATHEIGLYADPLRRAGYEMSVPDTHDAARIAEGIACVKRGAVAEGGARFASVLATFARVGADAVILGCTEVPPGLAAWGRETPIRAVDATAALARQCVAHWAAVRGMAPDPARRRPGPGGSRSLDKGPARP